MDDTVIKKLEDFLSQFPAQEYKKGEIIIEADKQPAGIFYIQSGIIRQYFLTENGEEITLNLYKPHSFLPMAWAIGNLVNEHFYEALTQVTVKRAPKEPFLAFLRREPEILYDLLRRVYIGIEGLWLHLESLTSGNSYTKLVTSLVILAKRFGRGEKDDVVIELKLNETDIANYSGMARETASRELQKLKKQNLVSFEKGFLIIHNFEKMKHILIQGI